MNRTKKLQWLISHLLGEMPKYREQADNFSDDDASQFRLFRSLVNVRPPIAADRDFIAVQDEYLKELTAEKCVINFSDLTPVRDGVYLWKGDITTLAVDGIVNAANSALLGCFCPCHGCIDNAIHTYAGIQLRLACNEIMKKQGHDEPTGQAKITSAFNLPCKYVLHTVGPIITGRLTDEDNELLSRCYRSCLAMAEKNGLQSIAFCCISTGEYHFPNDKAARIAIETVDKYKNETNSKIKVIYNVFKDNDYEIYRELLGTNR